MPQFFPILDEMGNQSKDPEGKAKIYLTKIIGGKVFESVIEKGSGNSTLLGTSGYSLIADGDNLGRIKNRISIECPVCGCSKEKFEDTGRFGCPECYQVFGPFLTSMLRKMHKGVRHVGKIPRSRVTKEVIEEKVKVLSDELAQAVKFENFEEAARLRDEIRGLQDSLKSEL